MHYDLGIILVIYVDDFKMAGPKSKVAEAWVKLRTGEGKIEMDDPKAIYAYLGCNHDSAPRRWKTV